MTFFNDLEISQWNPHDSWSGKRSVLQDCGVSSCH